MAEMRTGDTFEKLINERANTKDGRRFRHALQTFINGYDKGLKEYDSKDGFYIGIHVPKDEQEIS